jgi:hypothetical protein
MQSAVLDTVFASRKCTRTMLANHCTVVHMLVSPALFLHSANAFVYVTGCGNAARAIQLYCSATNTAEQPTQTELLYNFASALSDVLVKYGQCDAVTVCDTTELLRVLHAASTRHR